MKLAEMINDYHFSVQFEIILSLNRDVVVYDSFVKLFWPIHIPPTFNLKASKEAIRGRKQVETKLS